MMLLTQLINFTIMIVILTKFLYKPILKMLDERKKKIEEGLALTEIMKTKKEEINKEREEILDRAKEEAKKIVDDYRTQGKKTEADIITRANDEARQIKEKAKQDAIQVMESSQEELNKQVLNIAMGLTRTVLSEYLDSKTQSAIFDKKLAQLDKERSNGFKK